VKKRKREGRGLSWGGKKRGKTSADYTLVTVNDEQGQKRRKKGGGKKDSLKKRKKKRGGQPSDHMPGKILPPFFFPF